MDVKLTLNNNEILNIELQVYPDKYWTSRSIIYLCRAYDNIGSGDNYSLVKPTTLFCITDQELLPHAEQEFYAKYRLINLKSHHLYTDKFGINVLQLNHTDLAKNHPDIEEVGNLIFELNYDNQAKEILEGQRRYREQMNSQYTAGYTDAEEKYEAELAEKDIALAEKDVALAKKDATIADKDASLAENAASLAAKDAALSEKDATIAKLQAELEKYKEIET